MTADGPRPERPDWGEATGFDPSAGAGRGDWLPGPWLVRGVMAALGFGIVFGVFLLFWTPTLPNEQERTSAAPPTPVFRRGTPAPTTPGAAPPAGGGQITSPPANASPAPAERRHTIRPNDTLLTIAAQYDSTVDAIRAANPGLDERNLRVGAEIVIPPGR
jgi:hypothetical protein